jgi:hypothetical protein
MTEGKNNGYINTYVIYSYIPHFDTEKFFESLEEAGCSVEVFDTAIPISPMLPSRIGNVEINTSVLRGIGGGILAIVRAPRGFGGKELEEILFEQEYSKDECHSNMFEAYRADLKYETGKT